MLRPPDRPVLVARYQQARTTPMAARSKPHALRLRGDARRAQAGRARTSSSACAWSATRTGTAASRARKALAIARRLAGSGLIDFINVIRGHIDTDEALSHVIPGMGARSAPHLDFAGEVQGRDADADLPRRAHPGRRDGAPCDRERQARHGRHDPRASWPIRTSPGRSPRGASTRSGPASAWAIASTSIYSAARPSASTIRRRAARRRCRTSHRDERRAEAQGRRRRRGPGGPGGGARRGRARPRGHACSRRPTQAGGQVRLAAALKRRREIMGIVEWRLAECERLGVDDAVQHLCRGRRRAAPTPDVVIVATGGVPNTSFLDAGEDLVDLELGHPDRRGEAGRERAPLSTTMAPIPA